MINRHVCLEWLIINYNYNVCTYSYCYFASHNVDIDSIAGCSVGSDNDDDDDVIVVGEDMLDPELTTKLHERVLQIKKEINWSDEEDQEEDTQESELIIEETITSQTEYEDINTCSDTELESDTSLVSLDQLVYPDSVSSSLKVTRQGISGNNTHNCTPRYPILSIEKTPVHIHNRATEPLPRHTPIHPYSPPHSQPQYSSREFPTHSDHLEPPCFFCFNFHSAQSLRRNCLCPECSQIQDTSICSCPDCRDSLQLHFNPLPSYTVATQLCGCPACSEQPIVGNRLYTTTCDCQDCTRVKHPLQPAQGHRCGKRLLDIESSTSEYPVIKRPCT